MSQVFARRLICHSKQKQSKIKQHVNRLLTSSSHCCQVPSLITTAITTTRKEVWNSVCSKLSPNTFFLIHRLAEQLVSCACMCVCLCVWTITFELNYLWPKCLVCWLVLTYRSLGKISSASIIALRYAAAKLVVIRSTNSTAKDDEITDQLSTLLQ